MGPFAPHKEHDMLYGLHPHCYTYQWQLIIALMGFNEF